MKFTLLLALIVLSSTLAAKTYNIIGNTKTKTSYIKYLAKKCEKRNNITLSQCLLNTELFSKVKVMDYPEKALIEVEDRWTLIPVPQVKVSSAGSSYGVMLVERNFLGSGKLAVLGGGLGSGTSNYMFFYKDPNLFYSDWILELVALKADTDQEAYNHENVVYSLNEDETLFKIGIGHRFFSAIETTLGIAYQNVKYKSLNNYTIPSNHHSWFMDFEIAYSNSNYKFYFNEGIEASYIHAREFSRSDALSKIKKDILIFNYQKNIWEKHALQLSATTMVISDALSHNQEKLGGSPGLRGVQDRGLWTDKIITLSLDYQIPISLRSYGTWTIAPFSDYGLYESTYSSHKNFHSYGIGAYLYLKKVALPGVGLVYGRNNRFDENFFSFSIGMGGKR